MLLIWKVILLLLESGYLMVNWNMVLLMVVYFICAAVTCWVVCTGPLPPAIFMQSNITATKEWFAYGRQWTDIEHGGLSALAGDNVLTGLGWNSAT